MQEQKIRDILVNLTSTYRAILPLRKLADEADPNEKEALRLKRAAILTGLQKQIHARIVQCRAVLGE